MTIFRVTEGSEPFLLVSMKKGETIVCESDAMVMMEPGLELVGSLSGGVIQSFIRKFATGESLFQQKITAKTADADCLLAPSMNGDIEILNVKSGSEYYLTEGAFVAAENTVDIKSVVQNNIGSALFGQNGGFIILKASGNGQLCVTGSGDVLILDVETTGDEEYTIDNGHVVAWEGDLSYRIGVVSSGGMFRSIVNTMTSGEGMVFKFKGKGKVVVCSRNMKNLIKKILQLIPGLKEGRAEV